MNISLVCLPVRIWVATRVHNIMYSWLQVYLQLIQLVPLFLMTPFEITPTVVFNKLMALQNIAITNLLDLTAGL